MLRGWLSVVTRMTFIKHAFLHVLIKFRECDVPQSKVHPFTALARSVKLETGS